MWSYKNRHTLNILPQMRHWDLLGGMWKAKYGTFSSNRNTLKQRIKWTQIDTDTAVLSEYCTCGFDVDVMKNTDVDFTLFRRLLHGVAEECLTNLGKFLLFFRSLCELWGETAQIDNPHLYPFKTNFVWKYVFWCHFLRLVGMGSCGGSGCRRRATRLGSTSISRGQKTNDDVSILSFPTTPTAKFPRQISTLEPVGRLMAWHLLQPWPQPLNQVLNQNFHS